MGLENLKSAFSNISQNVQETKDKTKFVGDYKKFLPLNEIFDSYRETNVLNLSVGSLLPITERLDFFREKNAINFSFGSFLPMSDMFGRILPLKPIGVNPEKTTKDVSDLTTKFEKPTKDGIDLTTRLKKTTKDYGVVDYISNQKAPGFSIKQSNQSSTTLFTGISGKIWTNDINLGGSIYGIETEPQEVNYMNDINVLGFSANQLHKSPSKFVGVGEQWTNNSLYGNLGVTNFINNLNSYYTPVTPEILGFSSNFNKGGYTFGEDQKGNSKFLTWDIDGNYTGVIPTITHTNYHKEGDIFDNTIQLTPTSPSKWNSDSLGTTYYDSIHTQNPITDKFGGPVNFVDIESKYATGFTISGLDNPLETQFVGVDNKGATWDPTTSYYDNYTMNIPNFSKTFGDEAEGFSMETPAGQTVKFTTNVDVINTIGEPGNSEFLQTKNIIHPYNKTLPSNDPSGTSLLEVWSRAADIGSDKDGNILKRDNVGIKPAGGKYIFPGFHMKWEGEGDNVKRSGIIFHGKVEPDSAGSGDIRLKDVSSLGYGDLVLSKTWAGADITSKRSTVFSRIKDDTVRMGKFILSGDGLRFTANQNILGTFQQYKPLFDPASTIANAILPSEGTSIGGVVIPLPFIPIKKDFGPIVALAEKLSPSIKRSNMEYSEWLNERLSQAGEDETFAEIEDARKPIGVNAYEAVDNAIGKGLKKLGFGGLGGGDAAGSPSKGGITKASGINAITNVNTSMGTNTPLGNLGKGDVMTLAPIKDYSPLGDNPILKGMDETSGKFGNEVEMESSKEGMPFYFVDLRDNKKMYFRAFLSGLSETLSPTWNSETYIGRSEPVYRYASSEREISLTLKLVANTKYEFDMIQQKMNRLTSMCYPEYMRDAQMNNKIRMKPPLLKMRIGEYIGNVKNDGVTGFFSSLSVSIPDDATWEIKQGERSPKFFDVTIMFKIIHGEVPALVKQKHMGTPQQTQDHYQDFYGYTGGKE